MRKHTPAALPFRFEGLGSQVHEIGSVKGLRLFEAKATRQGYPLAVLVGAADDKCFARYDYTPLGDPLESREGIDSIFIRFGGALRKPEFYTMYSSRAIYAHRWR